MACTAVLHDRFLPNFCPDFAPVACQSELAPTAETAEPKGGKAFQRKLELPAWLMAWDGYSLAASVLRQVLFINARIVTHVLSGMRVPDELLHCRKAQARG